MYVYIGYGIRRDLTETDDRAEHFFLVWGGREDPYVVYGKITDNVFRVSQIMPEAIGVIDSDRYDVFLTVEDKLDEAHS